MALGGGLAPAVELIGNALARSDEGDVIEVRDKSRQVPIVLEAIDSPERDVPDYLDVDHDKLMGTFVRTPKLADVPYPVQMEPNLVIEYYSR